jgi:hypothetical protein
MALIGMIALLATSRVVVAGEKTVVFNAPGVFQNEDSWRIKHEAEQIDFKKYSVIGLSLHPPAVLFSLRG